MFFNGQSYRFFLLRYWYLSSELLHAKILVFAVDMKLLINIHSSLLSVKLQAALDRMVSWSEGLCLNLTFSNARLWLLQVFSITLNTSTK